MNWHPPPPSVRYGSVTCICLKPSAFLLPASPPSHSYKVGLISALLHWKHSFEDAQFDAPIMKHIARWLIVKTEIVQTNSWKGRALNEGMYFPKSGKFVSGNNINSPSQLNGLKQWNLVCLHISNLSVTHAPPIWNVRVVKRESCCGDIDGGGASLVPGRRCQSYLRPAWAPTVAFNKKGHTPS